jgi:RNA polymerase sigma factor (sigma-70 family)
MRAEDIYKKLKFHHLDQDDEQELVIKIWLARDSYDQEKGTLGTWIARIVKNYQIEKYRSKKEKERNLQIPLSYFDIEGKDGSIMSTIEAYLDSKELSPLQQMIASENDSILLDKINKMNDEQAEILLAKANGEDVCRVKLHRAKKAFKEKKYKYVLKNIETGQEFNVNTFGEAAEITEYTSQRVCDCFNKGKIFGNKWKIFSK